MAAVLVPVQVEGSRKGRVIPLVIWVDLKAKNGFLKGLSTRKPLNTIPSEAVLIAEKNKLLIEYYDLWWRLCYYVLF